MNMLRELLQLPLLIWLCFLLVYIAYKIIHSLKVIRLKIYELTNLKGKTMSDTFDLVDVAREYEADTIQFKRDNPLFCVSMLVSIYNSYDERFVQVGRIMGLHWDTTFLDWFYDVETKNGRFIIGEGRLERYVRKGKRCIKSQK